MVGAGTRLGPGTPQGWEAALSSLCLHGIGDQLCHLTALRSSGHPWVPTAGRERPSPSGCRGLWGHAGGHWGDGLPSLPAWG